MPFVLVAPGHQPDPLPFPLEGDDLDTLVEAFFHFTDGYDLACFVNRYPGFLFTPVARTE